PVRRLDGRGPLELRAMSSAANVLSNADGSARLAFGKGLDENDTSLTCAVYGPGDVRARMEQLDQATLQVFFKPLVGGATVMAPQLHAQEARLRETLAAVLALNHFPRAALRVVAQVTAEHGSVLAVAINATMLAVLDAGLPMRHVAAAVTCAFMPPPRDPQTGAVLAAAADDDDDAAMTARFVLDPSDDEERRAQSVHTLVFDNGSAPADGDAAAPAARGALLVHSVGVYTREEFAYAYNVSRAACAQILKFMRLSVE
ncbi:hypothetical protein CXG81DRAFT_5883, partial [Caulochytrium protostelioides]